MPVDFDASALVEQLNAHTSAGLHEVGRAEHGETGGAVYVRWPDGRDSVLTRSYATRSDLERTAGVLTLARSRGLPVPNYELIAELDDGIALVQQRLPGVTVKRINPQQLTAMLEINERGADLLADRPDVPVPPLRLRDPQWLQTLETYSDRSRQLLAAVRCLEPAELIGDDLVHLDFHPENVLFDEDGAVTGIVDWDGSAARGDRRFALIKFRFELAWGSLYPPVTDPAVVARLDSHLEVAIPPQLLDLYWAHWSLRMLNWTINGLKAPERDIELHLDLALSRLG